MTRRLTRLLRRRVSNLHPTIIGLMVGDVTGSLRILIVEDDALIGMLLADMLTAMGHAVCAVTRTQHEAVAAAEQPGGTKEERADFVAKLDQTSDLNSMSCERIESCFPFAANGESRC